MTRPLPELLTDLLVDRRHLVRQRVPLGDLAARVAGVVAEPGPREHAAVVVARTAQDVVEAVRFAGRHGLTVNQPATGAGRAGDLLVATAGLDECVVHPEGWARVGAGVTGRRVLAAAAPYGLAGLSGPSSRTSVVGHTTGGGLGPMARTYGLDCDRVRALEVVTGDGVLRRVTPSEHPELFFGLRGGGGALGIVTALELDLVRQPRCYGGALHFARADAAAVLERWRTWSAGLPELATTSVALLDRTAAVRFLWTGAAADGERALRAMRSAAPVRRDGVAERPYAAVDAVHADPVDPCPVHEGAALLSALPAEAGEALLSVAGPGKVVVKLRRLGGAIARPGAHLSAYCHRAAAHALHVAGAFDSAARAVAALAPWSTGGLLPDAPAACGTASDRYDAATLARLEHAVRTYDPDGVLALGRELCG